MKKNYIYILFTVFLISTSLFGQIEIYDGNTTTNVSGQTITVALYNSEYEGYIYIKNVSGRTEEYILIRKQLTPVDFNLTEQLCFGSLTGIGNCYNAGTNLDVYEFPTKLQLEDQKQGLIEYIFSDYDIPVEVNNRYYIANGFGDYIDSVDVKATGSLAVKEMTKPTSVTVSSYPNPANNVITVNVNGSNDNLVKIVDVLGKTIYVEKIGASKKVDVSNLSNGVYILKVTTASGTNLQSKRIIVKH